MPAATPTSQAIQLADIKLFHSNLKMPIVQLPLTTSLITLSQGTILLSPHPSLTPTEFASMGNVTDIVAPNLFHHLGINGAIAAFPNAKLWGSAGLEQKRKDLNWDAFLDASNWPYQAELVAINIAGNPKINEFVPSQIADPLRHRFMFQHPRRSGFRWMAAIQSFRHI
jgi:hypothetical protein